MPAFGAAPALAAVPVARAQMPRGAWRIGILGFGGDRHDGRSLEFEGSAAVLLHRTLALGAEYRTKPDNLNIADEDAAWDAFLAWAPSKHVSLTLAYVDLGNIVIADNQRGWYASVQVGL